MLPVHAIVSGTAAAALGLCLLADPASAQQMVDSPYLTGYVWPVGFTFHGTDLMYVWERGGVVRVVDQGLPLPAPLLDLSEEVGGWRDFGLLGFALDPAFASNGYYYLSYVVDRHHLMHYGTPSYNAALDDEYEATITRVTRFTADASTGFRTTVPGSRFVLFGESPSTGAPILYESHGASQIVFGRDGTLLVAMGDGASYLSLGDFGSAPQTYYQQALQDGILRPEENVGAFRSQMLTSFSGKILRLDPATGDGVPSNPFYDTAQPRSARSRTYALGLRNPFRMCLRPGTGSLDPALCRPGVLYVGDVCWYSREELNVITGPGKNLGWPMYEGIEPNPIYMPHLVENADVPNPLAGVNGCNVPFLRFQDLLHQAEDSHSMFFPNPCDPQVGIPPMTPTFVHTPPVLDWHHTLDDARVPVFVNGVLVASPIGTPASGVTGQQFHGGCSVGGCWHSGLSFPVDFGPSYYHADFVEGWIKRFEFNDHDELLAIHDLTTTTYPLMLGEHPGDHSLLYVRLTNDQMRAIRFGVEPAPTAIAVANVGWGHGALDVQFDARASFDPEGQPLTYLWDLGNGRTSTAPQIGYRFRSSGSPTLQQVQLTVTDSQGATGTATVPIAIDNSPPVVTITSFGNGDLYSLSSSTVLQLDADVQDAEHGAQQLTWSWSTALHHNSHVHPEPSDPQPSTSTVLTPTPEGGEFFAYSVELTVTDAGGLSTSTRQWLFPDTSAASTSVLLTSPASGDRLAPGAALQFSALTSGSVQRVEYYVEGELVGVGTAPPYAFAWTPTTGGQLVAMALAVATDGTSSNTRGITFSVEVPEVTKVRVSAPTADAVEAMNQAAAPITNTPSLPLGDDGTPWLSGLVFTTQTIPIGARIQSAWIEFTAASTDTGKAHFDIACDLHPTPKPIGRGQKDLRGRLTGAPVAWSPPDWLVGDSGPEQRTTDLTAIVQRQVNEAKWRHQLVFLLRGAGLRQAVAWDGNPLVAPLLSITWLPPLPTEVAGTVLADGAEDLGSGSVDVAANALPLGEVQGASHLVALQYALDVPAGALIESAHVHFTSAANDTGLAVLTIRAEAADDAPLLSSSPYDISTRPHVPTIVTWYPPEWLLPGLSGSDQRTPDLAALVQQIIDRPGWLPGQRLALLVQGSGQRTACSSEAGASDAPQLELHYKLP